MIKNLSTPTDAQREAFLSLKSPRDLAKLLDYSYSGLVYNLYKITDGQKYVTFEIPKKSGGTRSINAPFPALMIIQRRLNEVLNNVYEPKPVVYGFVAGKNIVENARKHKKKNWVLNLDIINFFPAINFGRVRGMFMGKPYKMPDNVATVLAQICCYNNELPQGAPTSPIVSNMICAKMDSELQDLAWRNRCFYTRYADDITFSTTLPQLPIQIATIKSILDIKIGKELRKIIKSNGFSINPKKTRAFSRQQRQEVTGLTVNNFPNVRRKYVMQIRAMLHAWEKYGLQLADNEYFTIYDKRHRNPENDRPFLQQIIKGKIEFLGMVKGHDIKIYQEFRTKYRYLSRRDKGIPLANIFPSIERKLIVYTEGPTDKLIFETAWKKLYSNDECLFRFESVELKPGFSGGTNALVDELNSHRKEHGIIIGIFDRDSDGIKSISNLHAEFIEQQESEIAIDRSAGAFLLPIPLGKENLAALEKLWIENYFSESALNRKTADGRGLVFEYKPRIIKETIGDKVVNEKKVDDKSIETATIKDGKRVFAEEIVIELPADEFEGFRLVFEKIDQTIKLIQPS